MSILAFLAMRNHLAYASGAIGLVFACCQALEKFHGEFELSSMPILRNFVYNSQLVVTDKFAKANGPEIAL